MRHKNIVIRVLVNIIGGAAAGAFLLGLFAFLVAGWEGAANGAMIGAIVGVMGGLAALGAVSGLGFWTGTVKRYGESHYKQQSGEDNQ